MTSEERRYLIGRAEAEIALAQESRSEAAVQAHYQLAEAYLARIYRNGEAEPTGQG